MTQTTICRLVNQMRDDLAVEYVTLDVATLSTGMTKSRLLKRCQDLNIRHIKRRNRWLVHKMDLLAALQQGSPGDAP